MPDSTNEALVEMQGVCLRYGDKEVLGSWKYESSSPRQKGLSWTIRRGERWGLFGPNGGRLVVLEDTKLELTDTRIWKNNARVFNLL